MCARRLGGNHRTSAENVLRHGCALLDVVLVLLPYDRTAPVKTEADSVPLLRSRGSGEDAERAPRCHCYRLGARL